MIIMINLGSSNTIDLFRRETLDQYWFNDGPAYQTVVQQWVNITRHGTVLSCSHSHLACLAVTDQII